MNGFPNLDVQVDADTVLAIRMMMARSLSHGLPEKGYEGIRFSDRDLILITAAFVQGVWRPDLLETVRQTLRTMVGRTSWDEALGNSGFPNFSVDNVADKEVPLALDAMYQYVYDTFRKENEWRLSMDQ